MVAYLLGLITLPTLAALGALGLWLWHHTFERTIGSNGCYACEAVKPSHPYPCWEIGAEPNWRWHWEGWRHRRTRRRAEHRRVVAEHKARYGW